MTPERSGERRCGARRGRAAFTMVELILVVSIIGVLSAIAVPRLANAGRGADYAAQHRDWGVIQKQIELYAIEHFGVYPAGVGDGSNAAGSAAAFGRQLRAYTDVNGSVSATSGSPYVYGPYLREELPPARYGPHKGRTNVRVITGPTAPQYNASFAVGWIYNATTGDIVPNVPVRAESEKGTAPVVDFGVNVVSELGEHDLGGELGAIGP